MATIEVTTGVVQASGIDDQGHMLQIGEATNVPSLPILTVPSGGVGSDIQRVIRFGGFSEIHNVTQVGGFSDFGNIVIESNIKPIGSQSFVTVLNTLADNVTSFASPGTSGSVEQFFDRSVPFFFEPSETDPNTERDFREIESFMVFTSTSIRGRSTFLNTTATGTIIGAKNDVFPVNPPVPVSHLGKTTSFSPVYTGPPTLESHIGATGSLVDITNSGTLNALQAPLTLTGTDSVTITDETVPFFSDQDPVVGSIFNIPSTDVTVHVKDLHSPLSVGGASFEDIYIDDLQVVSVGTVATGTLWPSITRTLVTDRDIKYVFERNEDFPFMSRVTVSGDLSDQFSPPNTVKEKYFFQIRGEDLLNVEITGTLDADPPVITTTDPNDLETGISADTHILFDVFDVARGVDATLTKLTINDSLVLSGTNVFSGSLNRTGSNADGLSYDYTPGSRFAFGSTVTGTIEATDLADTPNTDSLTYEFTISPTNSLLISNFFLASGQSTLLTSGTIISVDVTDTEFGVSSGTTTFTINGVTPSGLVTTPITSGLRFEVPAEPLVDFREDLTVFVHAENDFPGTFPQIEEETFLIRSGYDVIWPNKIDGETEVLAPHLSTLPFLIDAKNFAKTFAQSTEFFPLQVKSQPRVDLSASLISNIKIANMSAVLNSINPHFEYDKVITLEVEADDLEGNQLRFIHTFTIESKPN